MSNQNVLTHTFSNGLTLAAEIRPSIRAAAFQILMTTGSAGDPTGKEGLSGVLSELCYRGAGDLDSRALSDALDAIGMQRAGGAGSETFSFGGAVMSDNLDKALDLTADIVLRPALQAEELEPVRSLALQDLAALEDNPAQKMFVHLNRAYFTNEYGRPSLGTEESLKSLTAEDMANAQSSRFKPSGAIFSAAGRFDWNELKDAVEARFGSWEGSPPSLPAPERRADSRYVHIEQDTQQQHIGVAYDAAPPEHSDIYVSRMAVGVLSGGMGARLFTEVREKRGLVYAVSAGSSHMRGCGFVRSYAGTTPERAQETLDTLIAELKRLAEGVTPEELERARTGLLSSLVMSGESTGARAGAVAGDLYYLGRVRSLEEIRAQIEAVTPEAVKAHLEEFPPENFTIVVLGPRRLESPE